MSMTAMALAFLRGAPQLAQPIFTGCIRKTVFVRHETAENAAADLSKLNGYAMYSYACPHCGHFHLTKRAR